MSQVESSERINPLVTAREIGRFDREVDVLVVGFGCAGACTALEAAAAGAETLVLERASGGGGTSAMSGGVIYMGGGTDIQKQCGFEDSPEEMFKYLMAASGNGPDESKISIFCEDSVEHFHWLVDKGVPFSPVFYPHYSGEPPNDDGLVYSGSENAHPYNEIARPAPRGHVPKIPGAAGGLLMQMLVAAVDASPAQVLTDTICDALVRNDDGSIAGVVASVERVPTTIRARRGVVITTGGFINDDDMIRLHSPLLHRCSMRVGADGDDGSGIRMGMAVGASTLNLGMGSISLPIHPPKSASIGVLVNRYGQRFINEDVYMGRLGEQVLFHQEGIAYMIFDDAHFIRPEIERDVVAVGETVAELENELGLPSGALQATMELYNRYARKGEDPVLHKGSDYLAPLDTPPFGAIDCRVDSSMFAAFTLGGLRTNAHSEVQSAAGEVIPGLYAAGRSTSGIAAPGYASGISLGDGSFFGRRAGRRAAARRA